MGLKRRIHIYIYIVMDASSLELQCYARGDGVLVLCNQV